jgi:hypothetical protein
MLPLVFLLTVGAAVQDPGCARALAVAPSAVCVDAGRGVALADTSEEAERLAGFARGGETRFAAHFGQSIAPYAVTSTSQPISQSALNGAGFAHVLPWPNARAIEQATRQGIEQATRRFAQAQGMSAAQTDELVARAIAQAPTGLARAGLESALLPHELGHLWFSAAFWPDAAIMPTNQRHYGGPGPDWLDEAAAVLMEDDASTTMRRSQFRALLRGEDVPGVGVAERSLLLDLAGLFAREHPAITQGVTAPPNMTSASPGIGVGVVFTPAGPGGSAPARTIGVFYVQARVVSDYLIQKSGRPNIVADIARAFANGRTFEAWLRSEGAAAGLPSTMAALQADWEAYASRI